jgi:glycosyltransferase involved in cell wall biosynthesis
MNIAILHYSVAPVVGGVEAVIQAHARLLQRAGYHVTLIAGAGEKAALPEGVGFIQIPQMDSCHPEVVQISQKLEAGQVPENFQGLSASLQASLESALYGQEVVIAHNLFTKHFNLPLTAALVRLLEQGKIKRNIAWCHDLSWTSPHSRRSVHPGYPWDLLRTYREDSIYVTVSGHRQMELAGLFNRPPSLIKVVYDGVDPADLYGLSPEGLALVNQLGILEADLVLLMPVRITQAKNFELAWQVVAELKARGIHPRLVVTGPPDPHDPGIMAYYQSLLDLRQKLGVEAEVRFVYESGPHASSGYIIGLSLVNELLRACDVLFMPSHREGFGMPILEAGLLGMPIFTTEIPAASEIGGRDLTCFLADDPPEVVAGMILNWIKTYPSQRLRQRIRQQFTWQAIFKKDFQPLLTRGDPA